MKVIDQYIYLKNKENLTKEQLMEKEASEE